MANKAPHSTEDLDHLNVHACTKSAYTISAYTSVLYFLQGKNEFTCRREMITNYEFFWSGFHAAVCNSVWLLDT